MRSARLATVTVALFRQIDTILGFRSFSKGPQRLLSSQTTQTGYRSLSLISCRSTDSKFTLQRQLSTSDETENPYGKSSSFSVPAMGTDLVEDGSDYSLYERWVRRLYATNWYHPVKLGLQNMQQLDKLLGNPLDDPNRAVIHVAGTNGKGSVCLKLANTLRNQTKSNGEPLKVGIFCSPHVSSFRERMQVNGEMITEEEVIELLPQIYDLCIKHDIPGTFFEITTALSFLFFDKRKTDVVVLETGLGGLLDATNVIASPTLSIITSIGLEHTRILGDTIELIARQKAGIIKKDCPVLVGQPCPHEVIMEVAREVGSGRYYTPSMVEGNLKDFVPTPKTADDEGPKDYDKENQGIVKAALSLLEQSNPELFGKDLTAEDIEDLTSIRPSCRFETFQIDNATVILDVAHNPPAMEYLVFKLKKTYPEASFRFVAGMSSDKDIGQCARSLLSTTEGTSRNIHLVQAAHPRAATLEAILEAESSLEAAAHYDFEDRSITRQVLQALELTKGNEGEILVVCGSVFLMAETREALGFDEPRDSDCILEMAGVGLRHGQENFGNSTKLFNK